MKCSDCEGTGKVECEECGHDSNGDWNCGGQECGKCAGTGVI